MRLRAILILLLLALVVPASGKEDGLSKPAQTLFDTAWRMARGSKLRENQEERIRKACADVEPEEINDVMARLRAREKPPKSLHLVLGVLEREYLGRRFGPELLKAIPDVMSLLRSDSEDDAILVLAASLTLEDLRFARYVALEAVNAESPNLRGRAAMALADLTNYLPGDSMVSGKLLSLLDDPEAGVRAVACRRAFECRLDPVFPWAVEHLTDQVPVQLSYRGEVVSMRPGEEALHGLQAVTNIQDELEAREIRIMSAEQKQSLAKLYLDWWEGRGETFPAPGHREAKFRRKPSTEKSVVTTAARSTASLNFWAGLDRTRIRVSLDELEWNASSKHDFNVNFHLRYMAQGMRSDDGESYRRHFPVGETFVLARKKSGCFELVFQALHGDRLKIHFRFYDPLL